MDLVLAVVDSLGNTEGEQSRQIIHTVERRPESYETGKNKAGEHGVVRIAAYASGRKISVTSV